MNIQRIISNLHMATLCCYRFTSRVIFDCQKSTAILLHPKQMTVDLRWKPPKLLADDKMLWRICKRFYLKKQVVTSGNALHLKWKMSENQVVHWLVQTQHKSIKSFWPFPKIRDFLGCFSLFSFSSSSTSSSFLLFFGRSLTHSHA